MSHGGTRATRAVAADARTREWGAHNSWLDGDRVGHVRQKVAEAACLMCHDRRRERGERKRHTFGARRDERLLERKSCGGAPGGAGSVFTGGGAGGDEDVVLL